jgi:hypothetical protein
VETFTAQILVVRLISDVLSKHRRHEKITVMTNPSSDESQTMSSDGTVEIVSGPGSSLETPGTAIPEETIAAPAKVMRIGSMIKQLLEEVRQAPLDEASRARLRDVYDRSILELSSALSPDLQEELRELALPFDAETPSDAELRVAQAQLVGWLEGLFHGIQATLFAQQMAAQNQLQQMRQPALPPGQEQSAGDARPGTYL